MKENKIPVLCSTILLLAFTLMSCTDKVTAPKFKSHVDLSVIENDMLSFSNGYNAGKEGESYTADEFSELVSDFTFYTEIGKVHDYVETISFGNDSFNEGNLVEVSLGKAIIKDEAFKVVDDKLYVATPIIAFELLLEPKFTIYGFGWEDVVVFDTPVIRDSKLKNVQWQDGSTNIVTWEDSKEENPAYAEIKVNDSASNKWLAFTFEPQGKWCITQNLYLDGNGDLVNVSYSYIEAEKDALTLYPISYSDSEVSEHEWKSIEYEVVFTDGNGLPYMKTIVIEESVK